MCQEQDTQRTMQSMGKQSPQSDCSANPKQNRKTEKSTVTVRQKTRRKYQGGSNSKYKSLRKLVHWDDRRMVWGWGEVGEGFGTGNLCTPVADSC